MAKLPINSGTINVKTILGGAIAGASMQAQKNAILTSNGVNNIWLSSEDEKSNPYVKKQEIFELKEDLITLAASWYRYRKLRNERHNSTYGLTIESLTSKDLFEFVNEDDLSLADQIKNYYSKKFMLLKLKGVPFTQYRLDLNDLVHGDAKTVKESSFALAYYLPDFYFHDQEFDTLLVDYNKEVITDNRLIGVRPTKLKLVKTFKIQRKRIRKNECWFVDEHKNLVNMNTDLNNPLMSLLEKHVTDFVNVEGVFLKRKRDDYEFLEVSNLKFV